ncbi:hypothetical protein VZQ01_40155 [Myxococcus faecalis]|uniref:hypothetical protein n=1 Tax=Myxococcus faecalis TaxID=3115646 RepID=UPI003CF2B044
MEQFENWSYPDWNDRLINHHFVAPSTREAGAPVGRIPATPEELWLVAGKPALDPSKVANAFVQCVTGELPIGQIRFCTYCLTREREWAPDSPSRPHFFAMLWFTCLIAYGYPTGDGAFATRLERILGKHENFQHGKNQQACLPKLWRDFAAWTQARNAAGDNIRILQLPPESPDREVIGYSHFLAFPNRLDRNALARVLWDEELIGFEPPIQPVLAALEARHKQFSRDFVRDLADFTKRFTKGEDPRESPFWRAVRQEALEPSVDASGSGIERSPRTALLFAANDLGLQPFIACPLDLALPEGFEALAFEDSPEWEAYVTGPDGDLEIAWQRAFKTGWLLPVGTRTLLSQGLLILRQAASGQFEIVSGAEVHGCQHALVRDDRADAFVRNFGGNASPSVVDGWLEIMDCEVRQLERLPQGLESASQLLRTMAPPSVSLSGGIRVSGGFLFAPSLLPSIRAPGADLITIRHPEGDLDSCIRRDGTTEWKLPASIAKPGNYQIEAKWSLQSPSGHHVERTGEASLRLVEYVLNDAYKSKPAGSFYVEACPDAELDVTDSDHVPLGITTFEAEASADFLELDVGLRFLGPGIGEMSLSPKPGFDWLVLGPKNSPELIVFVGDPERPTLPAQRRSPRSGDRKHWRCGLNSAQQLWRDKAGRYWPLSEGPVSIRDVLEQYRRHKVDDSAPICEETRLDTHLDTDLPRSHPDERTLHAVDAIAALSSRRSGLRYQEARDVFDAMLGNDNPVVFQQVLRAWAEAGLVDVLRNATTSRLTILARQPRFVMVRRGTEVEATVMGMLSSVKRAQLREGIKELRLERQFTEILPGNQWQPTAPRIRATPKALEYLRQRAGLVASEWLLWPHPANIPIELDARRALDSLPRTSPPISYRPEAAWDWNALTFRRGARPPTADVQLERRLHKDSSAIYVVLEGGEPRLWSHLRSWAILSAYSLRATRPFLVTAPGRLACQGRTPVHLPLPLGRLCVLVGEGLPGPVFTVGATGVMQYVYPFGPRLYRLVERVLPAEWVQSEA